MYLLEVEITANNVYRLIPADQYINPKITDNQHLELFGSFYQSQAPFNSRKAP